MWGVLIACVFALSATSGCNRVPEKQVSANPIAAAVHGTVSPSIEAAAQKDNADKAEDELLPACQRACGNWVSLKFVDPTGLDKLSGDRASEYTEMMERQRALNLAACEENCLSAKDRTRTRCIRRAMTAEEADACARR